MFLLKAVAFILVLLGVGAAAKGEITRSRTSCKAQFGAPCARENAEFVAVNTAQQLTESLRLFESPAQVFSEVTNGTYNMETGFYPVVFDRLNATCVGHGFNSTWVGMTLDAIYEEMGIGFSLGEDLHSRFEQAADTGGNWVNYLWRENVGEDISLKAAFVANISAEHYVFVGYNRQQLPLDLPCTDKHDAWCSINNVQSLLGKAQDLLNEALSMEQFETALYHISFDADYFVPGGHYLFMYHYDGPLKAHPYLHRFAGHDLEYIFEQLGRDPKEGIELHKALRSAAEGSGWVQYLWKNKVDEPEYVKIAYNVKIEFMGEYYYLGCGLNFIIGDVVQPSLKLEIAESDGEDQGSDSDGDEEKPCPGYNLPCSFGSTRQLSSHVFAHGVSSSLDLNKLFDAVTHDPIFKVGSNYAFIYDFNSTCVSHGSVDSFVGMTMSENFQAAGIHSDLFDGEEFMEYLRQTALTGGGYAMYDWSMQGSAGVAGTTFQKVSYIFQLTRDGRDYLGGVGFDHVRAPLQPELDTGTQANGGIIPCSSEFGSSCSEINSQAILGQALGDLVLASSETKVRVSELPFYTDVDDVFSNITAGNVLYKYNDFYVSVFALDQSYCYDSEGGQDRSDRDLSGCCVAHGGDPSFVGKTWQDILHSQGITSIRGRDLHERLIGESDRGGHWVEYSWAVFSGSVRTKRAFSSRFKDNGSSYYVVVEYFTEIPPRTCDACPSDMECTEPGQYFCEPKEDKTPFYQSTAFVILMIVVVGFPCLGVIFCWIGKKRQEKATKAHMEEIGQQMQTMSKQMEDEKKSASRAKKLVSSLFPEQVHERIMEQIDEEEDTSDIDVEGQGKPATDNLRKSQLGSTGLEEASTEYTKSRPIADLFPEATISFGDIVGFTAWSSTRDPSQVFSLLEAIYSSFDKIANRMKVFKVETVGDCYVAACGLPESRDDHAVVMARFSCACLAIFQRMIKKLEAELGPGTQDLKIRFGLHSGPVTAGVLRGEKGRFQLFGDTVNTAARMESTGSPNRIHLSQELVDLLLEAGKSHWVSIREDKVVAKGKGLLNTYWLNATAPDLAYKSIVSETSTETDSTASSDVKGNAALDRPLPSAFHDQNQGLVEWNLSIMKRVLAEVVAKREECGVEAEPVDAMRQLEKEFMVDRTSLKEVKEIVSLPRFNSSTASHEGRKTDLSDTVLEQLRSFIHEVSVMYNNNPFHNFQHATHVTMSVVKLLSRIVAPEQLKNEDLSNPTKKADLHDHTYGITSDPLTQFAVLLSALVHDLDHPGVTNSQLVQEGASIATVYPRSVAELNSLDLAWNLLMDDKFGALRRAIYTTKDEFFRFRQLMVNVVLATDIIDKDLGALRKERWNKAFNKKPSTVGLVHLESEDEEDVNRKATIVLEHLIQASDVAHTMQHWNVYQKWNQRFFFECYAAYKAGRAPKNPLDTWYEGEIGFFDFYIIPLAKKLKDCGVFGVSSAEYLRYAQQNRQEWEARGRDIVAELVAKCHDMDAKEAEMGRRPPAMNQNCLKNSYAPPKA